jgi:hypothetical protein
MTELEEKNTRNIADHILGLINYIAQNCTSWWVNYNSIDMEILNNYNIDWEKLHDILGKDVFIPKWMNIYANRKY